jgi:hypothetical protein
MTDWALVVGIERYATPLAKALQGPGLDALRFALWLYEKQRVSPENIILILNKCESDETPAQIYEEAENRVTAKGIKIRDYPSRQLIMEAWRKELLSGPEVPGTLWLYWSGHGCTFPPDQDVVLCADVEFRNPTYIFLKEFRDSLRSQEFRSFKKQRLIVDACASYLRPEDLNITCFRNPESWSVTESPDQVELDAVPVGSNAIAEQGGSLFSRLLLNELENLGWPDNPIDLDSALDKALRAETNNEYKLLRIHIQSDKLNRFIGIGNHAIAVPSANDLTEYCTRLANRPMNQLFVQRIVTRAPRSNERTVATETLTLDKAIAENSHIILLGEGGLGKTSALQHRERNLAAQYLHGTSQYVPVYLRLADYRGGKIVKMIAERVNGVLTGSGRKLAQTAEESARVVDTWLSGIECRVEILMDGLNEIPEDQATEFRTHLEDFLGYPHRCVFSSRDRAIGPLQDRCLPVFLLSPLSSNGISELLYQKLGEAGEPLHSQLMTDRRLASLLSNPFMLDLIVKSALTLKGHALPEGRAHLIRESVREGWEALEQEGKLLGTAKRSGVIEKFLERLAWEMLRAGVVSTDYSSAFGWKLPTSGFALDDVLRDASRSRLLRSAQDRTPIEFRHPLFRDYFAAERIAVMLAHGSDLDHATGGQFTDADWLVACEMAAELNGAKAHEVVEGLMSKGCLDSAFACWTSSEVRNNRNIAATLAASLRASVISHIENADSVIAQLGELQDREAVPIIVEFMKLVGPDARFEAIPALEKIRSEEALGALLQALDGADEETTRDAREALLRIGAEAVPVLLLSSSGAAERVLIELAPTASYAP